MRIIFIGIIFVCVQGFSQQLPTVCSGTLSRLANFHSIYLDNRPVDIWLPEIADKNRRYDVLYMHDGQMLFDSSMTWNKQVWDVDDIITRLRNENKIREVIVVGIWNNDKSRHADYFPQKAFELLRKEHKELIYSAARSNGYSIFNDYAIRSDDYLKFLVREVKPLIDSLYPTNSSMENTFIAGSSMGGLISLYAICEYPEVFGGAACLSTHWPGIFTMDNNPVPEAFVQYLQQHLPDPKTHKIYFDHGDQTLDALYPPLQNRVDEVMKSKGFTGQNWKTLSFPGEDHSEKAWNKRFDIPLIFLLGR